MDEKDRKRFYDKVSVDPETGCHNWTGARHRNGYGAFGLDGKVHRPHRIAYELFKGRIPEGLEIDHLCRNRGCVNPDHLEAVSHQENMRRGVSARTHCSRGHPLSGDNLYTTPNGYRVCKTCRAESVRRYRAKKKGADLANEADAQVPTTKGENDGQ